MRNDNENKYSLLNEFIQLVLRNLVAQDQVVFGQASHPILLHHQKMIDSWQINPKDSPTY